MWRNRGGVDRMRRTETERWEMDGLCPSVCPYGRESVGREPGLKEGIEEGSEGEGSQK